ncbi:hypothetical protein FACS1894174_04230 [Bacteroidia bacterium]|nr:hypothetical protein FACS1894174_04230 [Bacteroidia bacterium]
MTLVKNKATAMMQFRDIALDVTWSKIAARYFPAKSASWFYNKLNGRDGNGGEGDFTYAEKLQLRNGLYDFAERIRRAADSMDI